MRQNSIVNLYLLKCFASTWLIQNSANVTPDQVLSRESEIQKEIKSIGPLTVTPLGLAGPTTLGAILLEACNLDSSNKSKVATKLESLFQKVHPVNQKKSDPFPIVDSVWFNGSPKEAGGTAIKVRMVLRVESQDSWIFWIETDQLLGMTLMFSTKELEEVEQAGEFENAKQVKNAEPSENVEQGEHAEPVENAESVDNGEHGKQVGEIGEVRE